MSRYYIFEKKVGETPLSALNRLRSEKNIASDVPLAYAGRLDPMARGKLLVLVGDECKQQEKYHKLDKEYVFEVLFGVSTDTGDILGVVGAKNEETIHHEVTKQTLDEVAKHYVGTQTFPYPRYSSKTVQGKPLFLWTLENRLNEIEIPQITSTIYTLDCLSVRTIPKDRLHQEIKDKIGLLPKVEEVSKELGRDFRRQEVLEAWEVFFQKTSHTDFTIAQFRTSCSSGTYIRTLGPVLAKAVGTHGLAFSIHRTKIGN